MKTKYIHTRFHLARTTDHGTVYGAVDLKVVCIESSGRFIENMDVVISLN